MKRLSRFFWGCNLNWWQILLTFVELLSKGENPSDHDWIRKCEVVLMVPLPLRFFLSVNNCLLLHFDQHASGHGNDNCFFKTAFEACVLLTLHFKSFVTTSVFQSAAHATSKYEAEIPRETYRVSMILVSRKFQLSWFWILSTYELTKLSPQIACNVRISSCILHQW